MINKFSCVYLCASLLRVNIDLEGRVRKMEGGGGGFKGERIVGEDGRGQL